jgi:hypothetical protein
MAFFTKLRQAYDHRDTGEYGESHSFEWVQGIRKALVTGEKDGLGTMVNVGGNHWIALALDFTKSLIWYGDSLGRKPAKQVTSVVNWWTFYHTGTKFAYQKLKILSQTDGYSCGLLGTNALGNFYLLEKYPLIDAAKVDTERVRVLLQVVQRHLDVNRHARISCH